MLQVLLGWKKAYTLTVTGACWAVLGEGGQPVQKHSGVPPLVSEVEPSNDHASQHNC